MHKSIDNRRGSQNTFTSLLFCLFALLASLFIPFFFGVTSIFNYILTKRRGWLYFFFISFVFLFSNMNLNKEIWAYGDFLGVGNDLGWYSSQWFAFSNYQFGFMTIFDNDYSSFFNDGLLVRPKVSEPVYHAFAYSFSRLTGGNYIFYTYAVTSFIYLPSCFVIYKIMESSDADEFLIAMVMVFFVSFSMTFTNTFNLIRHYCSGSLLMLSLYFFYFDVVKRGLMFGTLAVLTHNAAFAVLVVYVLAYSIDQYTVFSNRYKLLLVVLTVSVISIVYLCVYNSLSSHYEYLNDKGAGILIKIIDLVILFFSVVAYSLTKETRLDKLWLYYFGVVVLICFMHFTNFLQVRYFSYFDYFRWIGILYFFNKLIHVFRYSSIILFFVLFFSLSFLWLRIYISDFDFNGMLHDYFFLVV